MNIVWKLLRQHISIPQIAGFFFANLFGMFIVLAGYQFYRDVIPVFTAKDTFLKADYIVVNKKIGNAMTLTGADNTFTDAEIDDFSSQPFVKRTGRFTHAGFIVNASMGISGQNILSSEIFIESVPDGFIDVPLTDWKFSEDSNVVPVILPKSYINMYNFGFAQSRNLPKISDGLAGMIDLRLRIHGNDKTEEFKGKVIGFSNRLNTILAPQSFMEWGNEKFSSSSTKAPTRLILEIDNPTDSKLTSYLEKHNLELDKGDVNAEKTASFLRMLVIIVVVIGLLISILSFYILMLSIYLLVQKNTTKLENLLLVGYSPSQVARPYQILTFLLNSAVLAVAASILFYVRSYYMYILYSLFPQLPDASVAPSMLLGVLLLVVVSLINVFVIRRKVIKIWFH